MTTDDLFHFEAYKGRQIEVTHRPHHEGQYSHRAAGFEVTIDGKPVYASNLVTEHVDRALSGWAYTPMSEAEVAKVLKKAIKKGRDVVDQRIADAEIRPFAEQAIAVIPRAADAVIAATGQDVNDFVPRDRVWVYSRGNIRQGVVEKVGKTNITVAYVTKKGGQITRKSFKPEQVGFKKVAR